MKKLTFLLVAVLLVVATQMSFAKDAGQDGFAVKTINESGVSDGAGDVAMLCSQRTNTSTDGSVIFENFYQLTFKELIDITSIETRDYHTAGEGGGYDMVNNYNEFWVNGVFTFFTTNGNVTVSETDFVNGVYDVNITGIIGLKFVYESYITDQQGDYCVFNLIGTKTTLISEDDLAVLNDSISALNNLITSLTANLETANALNSKLTTTIDSLELEIQMFETTLADTITSLQDSAVVAYDNGVASVDTVVPYDNGWSVGYDLGFEDGVATVDTLTFWTNGYNQGLLDCGGDTTSVSTMIAPDDINIYPNPVNVSETLTIDTDNFSHIEVYTTTGSMVISDTNTQLELNGVETGLYLVKVYDNNGRMSTTKITIQ